MVIDAVTHEFMSQRKKRDMALIVPKLNWGDGLRVTAPGMEPLMVPAVLRSAPPAEDLITVKVWDDDVIAAVTNNECDEWFSKFLKHPVRLVRMLPPAQHQRALPSKYMPENTKSDDAVVSFADGFPGLLLAEESLKELVTRSGSDASVRNFRPNVMVAQCSIWNKIVCFGLHFSSMSVGWKPATFPASRRV
jgi:uncharacterized protein YcbX